MLIFHRSVSTDHLKHISPTLKWRCPSIIRGYTTRRSIIPRFRIEIRYITASKCLELLLLGASNWKSSTTSCLTRFCFWSPSISLLEETITLSIATPCCQPWRTPRWRPISTSTSSSCSRRSIIYWCHGCRRPPLCRRCRLAAPSSWLCLSRDQLPRCKEWNINRLANLGTLPQPWTLWYALWLLAHVS